MESKVMRSRQHVCARRGIVGHLLTCCVMINRPFGIDLGAYLWLGNALHRFHHGLSPSRYQSRHLHEASAQNQAPQAKGFPKISPQAEEESLWAEGCRSDLVRVHL